jgi:glycerate 2-kinase
MCRGAGEVLGKRLSGGVAAAPASSLGQFPERIRAFPGGHPLPDEGSLAAGAAVVSLLARATGDDLVLVLVSGGGSAMLELPDEGVSLKDLRTLNVSLLRSGLPIEDVNLVRSSISQTKAGGLARMAGPARVVALVVSDVPNDDLASIASGPTVPRPDRRRRAAEHLRRAGLWTEVPASVREALLAKRERGLPSALPYTLLIASNRHAVAAAARTAAALGFRVDRVARPLRGEARLAGERLARRLLRTKPPRCLLAGGETTVTVTGGGKGGRNQELALQAAREIDGRERIALMTLATDGIDGPTDAAGAVVTGATAAALRIRGVDIEDALLANDSYRALDEAGALLRTGPTGTNVADLVIGLRYKS